MNTRTLAIVGLTLLVAALVAPLASAQITANPAKPEYGQAVSFTATAPVSKWDFGTPDATSTSQNPVYTFPGSGVFTVTATKTGGGAFTLNVTVIIPQTAYATPEQNATLSQGSTTTTTVPPVPSDDEEPVADPDDGIDTPFPDDTEPSSGGTTTVKSQSIMAKLWGNTFAMVGIILVGGGGIMGVFILVQKKMKSREGAADNEGDDEVPPPLDPDADPAEAADAVEPTTDEQLEEAFGEDAPEAPDDEPQAPAAPTTAADSPPVDDPASLLGEPVPPKA
jgi:PKD repeat protein